MKFYQTPKGNEMKEGSVRGENGMLVNRHCCKVYRYFVITALIRRLREGNVLQVSVNRGKGGGGTSCPDPDSLRRGRYVFSVHAREFCCSK